MFSTNIIHPVFALLQMIFLRHQMMIWMDEMYIHLLLQYKFSMVLFLYFCTNTHMLRVQYHLLKHNVLFFLPNFYRLVHNRFRKILTRPYKDNAQIYIFPNFQSPLQSREPELRKKLYVIICAIVRLWDLIFVIITFS